MIYFRAIISYVFKVVKTIFERFMNNFTGWLKTIPEQIKNSVTGELIGCRTFVNTSEGEVISKNYSYSDHDDKWYAITASRVVSLDEVPYEIREKAAENGVVDVTKELEMFIG